MEYNLERWAEQQWGTCNLGDVRRTRRAVETGRGMAGQPDRSLPNQMGDRAALDAAYRLLNNPAVTYQTLLQPHQQATLAECRKLPLVLLIQDRTTLDYSRHPATQGLGPVGSRQQRGLFVHSTLAVTREGAQVLGLAHAQCIVRPQAKPDWPGHRRHGSAEGEAWENAVKGIGSVPGGTRWVYVSDRESDIYEYLLVCQTYGAGFVVRGYRNRALQAEAEGESQPLRLWDEARSWPPAPGYTYTVSVSATQKTPKREATLGVSWNPVSLRAPAYLQSARPLAVNLVHAWEATPPTGVEAVEWFLLTSEPVSTLADAQRILAWYECRWLVEDFHQCLKTGCRVEEAQLDHGLDLQRLLGFEIPIAVRLLQLRQAARKAPDTPAQTVVEPKCVQLLAAHFQLSPKMTIADFWKHVARLGGHLGRKSDGPPGWRTLCRGWLRLEQWLYAAQLRL